MYKLLQSNYYLPTTRLFIRFYETSYTATCFDH